MRHLLFAAMLMLGAALPPAYAFDAFHIQDIRVEGLQRIEVGTVFNYLPVNVGDTLDEARAAEAVRALFKTGFFSDVHLQRVGDALIVVVEERPSVNKVKLTGNKDIHSEDLTAAMKRIGLAEGHIFDRSALEQVERELERQYFARGKYGVKIKTKVEPLERNRVDVSIEIDEGDVAKIREINLVGNKKFSTGDLLKVFQLGPPTLMSMFSQNDQYSKQKLAADLETLRSFYLDRGYIDFNVESTQVANSPDKKNVYITVNLSEGDQFTVSEVKLAGELKVPEAELQPLISVAPSDIFSRKEVTESAARINERLGKEGYAFANINPTPDVDRERRTVKLTFFVDPNKRVYVRRVNVSGNTRTRDEVVRREVRQMEGGWISTEQVNRSRVRLQRLGYFEEVNVDVKERSSFGSLMAGVGFSQSQGVLLNASVTQDNFLGTGKRISAQVNNSQVNTIYSFSYTNPYYTLDGVSRGFRVYSRTTDAGQANVGDFSADAYGAAVNYGFPLSEYNSARLSLGYEHNAINTTTATPQLYRDYLTRNGDNFDAIKLTLGWSHDTRDEAFFPTKGMLENLSLDTTLPGSGLDYYKASNRTTWYRPLNKRFTFSLDGELAYGAAYGGTNEFPFFENYYAGGIRSVRGYRSNSLGPRENTIPLGGAFRVLGSMELLFAPPFAGENNKSFRMGAFVDLGNVFEGYDTFDAGEIRYSSGVSATWLSPIGPLTFSLAIALNDKPGDETEFFQFSLGAAF